MANQSHKDVDDMGESEVEKLHAQTMKDLAAIRARWRGLVPLTEKARAKHAGKSLGGLMPALTTLFTAMLPNEHDDSKTAQARTKFAEAFDVHGATDGGEDPERFEAALLLRRMKRIAKQQEVADELSSFGRLLADDVLHTSETVLTAGQHALDTARSMGEDNAKYGPFLKTVFDALRAMTKAALARATELRAERAAAKAAAAAEAAKLADAAKAGEAPKKN